jgi:PHD/YefM family antitoxin component YafN of YafNO toxin-antitoxin module
MAARRFVGTNEFQQKPSSLLKKVTSSGETCFITQDGKATAVLIDINRYNALMDLVEDGESPAENNRGIGDETRQCVSIKGILRRTRVMRRKR